MPVPSLFPLVRLDRYPHRRNQSSIGGKHHCRAIRWEYRSRLTPNRLILLRRVARPITTSIKQTFPLLLGSPANCFLQLHPTELAPSTTSSSHPHQCPNQASLPWPHLAPCSSVPAAGKAGEMGFSFWTVISVLNKVKGGGLARSARQPRRPFLPCFRSPVPPP